MRLVVVAAVVLVTGCSGGEPGLLVGVASSMSETAVDLGAGFGDVELSIAGSQVLVAQVREGAPLDVVIAADLRTAQAIADLDGSGAEPVLVAGNRLAIAVAEGNPLNIDTVDDLAGGNLRVVLAAPQVPAGGYTEELLSRAGLALTPASREPSVRSVLTKVRLGEADAGIVYETDLLVGGVEGVSIPGPLNPAVEYYAVALVGGANPDRAVEFVEFLLGSAAGRVFIEHGFSR